MGDGGDSGVRAPPPVRSDVAEVVALALVAMANPSLLAAVTVMLLLPNPKLLMAAYLLGAYTTSLTVGLVIVFSLHGSSFTSTSRHQISPRSGHLPWGGGPGARAGDQKPAGRTATTTASGAQAGQPPARQEQAAVARADARQRFGAARVPGRRSAQLPRGQLSRRPRSHHQPQCRRDPLDPARRLLLRDAADPARGAAAQLHLRAHADSTPP